LEEELKKENKEVLSSIQDVLDDVKCSCTIAVDILNDLLLYEKLDDGIFTLSQNLISIGDFFLEAINVFKVQAKSSEIELMVSTKGLEGVMVKIDRTKFSQVLRNIVSNALKFTPRKGKISVSCHILCSATNDYGVVFADSGIPTNTTDTNEKESNHGHALISPEEYINRDSGFVRISVTDMGPGISKVRE
jgi:signal transduction histidine kinase